MKKLLNKKGFTLMEMLIVVAIIVILVAISIPTFSNSLDSAKKATDAANFRSAKSALVMQTMNGSADEIKETAAAEFAKYYYDFEDGKFIKSSDLTKDTAGSLGECSKHNGLYITLKQDATTKVVSVQWSDGSTNCD